MDEVFSFASVGFVEASLEVSSEDGSSEGSVLMLPCLLHLLTQAFRFLNNRVLDRSEFFLLRERIMLPGSVLIVALQRIAHTVPDGIIRCYLRQLFRARPRWNPPYP